MTQFQVDSELVLVANSQVQATIGKLQNEIEMLHSQLTSLQDSWRGVAAESFQQLALRWRTTATAVEHQLAEIGVALSTAATHYAEAEFANQRLFAN
ncbi:MAG: WXG100 family type VII secretion target [Actinomycetes bacterium]